MVLFLCHQIIVPLRSHFYEGTVAWNEKGHRWSWRMKLRDKVSLFSLMNTLINEN